MATEFKPFPKMARLSREVIVTEKIDGTNAQVTIVPIDDEDPEVITLANKDGLAMLAGSRTRWLTRQTDNFGFAKWVQENAEDLWGLGEGNHFGEWWGSGIQRGYGLSEKRFSLFNCQRWMPREYQAKGLVLAEKQEFAPACCHVIPIIARGIFGEANWANMALDELRKSGSLAAPGYMNPEGVVVYHIAGNVGFKKTLEKDEQPKGLVNK